MILPTKRISEDEALLSVGADLLRLLERPQTVSRLWEEISELRSERENASEISYEWFVLALDLLFALGTIERHEGRLKRSNQ